MLLFSEFLNVAAVTSSELINYVNIASEIGYKIAIGPLGGWTGKEMLRCLPGKRTPLDSSIHRSLALANLFRASMGWRSLRYSIYYPLIDAFYVFC